MQNKLFELKSIYMLVIYFNNYKLDNYSKQLLGVLHWFIQRRVFAILYHTESIHQMQEYYNSFMY